MEQLLFLLLFPFKSYLFTVDFDFSLTERDQRHSFGRYKSLSSLYSILIRYCYRLHAYIFYKSVNKLLTSCVCTGCAVLTI